MIEINFSKHYKHDLSTRKSEHVKANLQKQVDAFENFNTLPLCC